VTTVSQNRYDQVIISHRCSEPNPKVEAIYRRLNYKSKPKTNRKFVVHKSEFQKWMPLMYTFFRLDGLQSGLSHSWAGPATNTVPTKIISKR